MRMKKRRLRAAVRRACVAAMQPPQEPQPPPAGIIECRVTRWYFKRMAMLAAMLLVFAAFFFYDGRWGYPSKNKQAEVKERFETEVLKGYDEAKKAGSLGTWRAEMKAKNWPADDNGEPPKWLAYSSKNGLPEKPKKYTDREIAEQFWWGGGMAAAALIAGILVLMNKNKMFRGGDDHFVMPDGRLVRFADVFKIDKRRWLSKGLATVFYKDAAGGAVRKAVIDCMKYDEKGVEAVMQRLLSQFNGELIEKVEEPEEDAETEPAASGEAGPRS